MEGRKNIPTVLPAIILLAILLRVVYWLHACDEAWFLAPGMDPLFYTNWADDILAGRGGDYLPFPRAPLYPYILALIRGIFGPGWLWLRLLNLTAEIATIVMVFLLGGRIGGNRVAVCAAVIYALCGASVYFSGEILMTSLATLAATGSILTLAAFGSRPRPAIAAASGMILSVLILFRPNALILLPIMLFVIYFKGRKLSPERKIIHTSILAFLLSTSIMLTPVIILNYKASHKFIPVSTQGGVNFYIGNARNASGWASELPGVGANWSDGDAQNLAETNAGRPLTQVEASHQFWRMGWREIQADPGGWIGLCLKKLLLLVNAREIGNNRSLSLPLAAFPLLKLLFLISLGTMAPFALLGLLHNRRDFTTRVILIFILFFGCSLIIFFVNTRYRMVLYPLTAVLAGAGLVRLRDSLKGKHLITRDFIIIILGSIVTLPSWVGGNFESQAQANFIAGNACLRLGKGNQALERYRETSALNPDYPELHLNIGVALLAVGDTLQAEDEFQQELRINPSCAKAINNLGVIVESRGELEYARNCYLKALSIDPEMEDAIVNGGRVLLKMGDDLFQAGDLSGAETYYEEASELLNNDPRPICRLAITAASRGDLEHAVQLLYYALELDPEYKPAMDLLK